MKRILLIFVLVGCGSTSGKLVVDGGATVANDAPLGWEPIADANQPAETQGQDLSQSPDGVPPTGTTKDTHPEDVTKVDSPPASQQDVPTSVDLRSIDGSPPDGGAWEMGTPDGHTSDVSQSADAGTMGTACAGDLSACLQAASPNGGIVILEAKEYVLTRTLELRSGVTLQGQGSATIIAWDDSVKTTINSPLLHTTSADDVSLKDFMIQCSINQDPASKDMRNDHIGLFFDCGGDPTAGQATECNDLTLERLEVAYCSHGIHIKGATGVKGTDLKLHHNGNTEVDLFHNVYFRRVANLRVKQTTPTSGGFYSSPRGHGIRASYIKNAYFEGLTVYNNADHGVHLADLIVDMRLYAMDVHDNCVHPSGGCYEFHCYGSCEVNDKAPKEP